MGRIEWFLTCWFVTVLCPGVVAAYDLLGWNYTGTYNHSNQNDSAAYASCRDPTLCIKTSGVDENVGLAFGLTIGAGLATTLGALLPLAPCVRKSNTKVLAASLGFAVGVMLYVSFTELWQVSRDNLCCHFSKYADLATTIAFFTGILVTVLLNLFVWSIQRVDCGCSNWRPSTKCLRRLPQLLVTKRLNSFPRSSGNGCSVNNNSNIVTITTTCNCEGGTCSGGCGTLNGAHQSVELSQDQEQNGWHQQLEQEGTQVPSPSRGAPVTSEEESLHAMGPAEFREVTDAVVHDKKHLTRMGVLTGLAIAIHNFPEGVATFVGSLSSPSLGGVLAFAIAIHNIPEGICVAMPIYYATGSKWKGIFWASLSGASEPIGAILAYVVLRSVFSPLVYGICFGLISGMMVYIALKELLPTAYKFANPLLVSFSLMLGMVVMAVSLMLLQL